MTDLDLDLIEKLDRRTVKGDGCWVWSGTTNQQGYARIYLGGGRVRRQVRSVSRLLWETHVGPIPDGMFVCHRCDNPRCVRLDHLFLGTPGDNNRDRDTKGRGKTDTSGCRRYWSGLTHCKNGHEFNAINTRIYRGQRKCRVCQREWLRKKRGIDRDDYRV